jgi:hypothetical protein
MRWIIIAWAWLTGAYFGYLVHPDKVTERYVKVICIPDSDTDAKPGDSLEFKVEDWIEFNNKIKTEKINYHQ